ncbi:MAG: hypothetical protein V4591_07020 [Bdellovibrionota bacterium]
MEKTCIAESIKVFKFFLSSEFSGKELYAATSSPMFLNSGFLKGVLPPAEKRFCVLDTGDCEEFRGENRGEFCGDEELRGDDGIDIKHLSIVVSE